MGRLVRTQEVGEGMNIEGAGKSIDLTLLKIRVENYHQKVKLQVEGVNGLERIELQSGGRLVELIKDIRIGVGDRHETSWKIATMVYEAPKEYKFSRKEFGDNGKFEPYK